MLLPEGLLRSQSNTASKYVPAVSTNDGFEDEILMLRDYSFVTATTDEKTFEMHNLVQMATKRWLELDDQVNVWQRAALRIMAVAFPSGQHETWAACQTLLPHSTKVLGYSTEKDEEATLDQATIATNMTWYLMLMGQYAEAERIGRSAVTARERVLRREHPDTLISVSNLGSVLESQGKYEEAEAMHRRALEGSEKVLRPEHPDTLKSVYCLAHLLANPCRYDESLCLYDRACAAYSLVLGEDHPITRACRQHRSGALASQELSWTLPSSAKVDNGASIHSGKISRLSRGLAKLGVRRSRHGGGERNSMWM